MPRYRISDDERADMAHDLTFSYLDNEMRAVPDSYEGVCVRSSALFHEFKLHLVGESCIDRQSLLLWATQLHLDASGLVNEPTILLDFLRLAIRDLRSEYPTLKPSIRLSRTRIPAYIAAIPTMSHLLTLQYYVWLGRQYRGAGEIVEVGTWFGASAAALAEGTKDVLAAKGKRIRCFDSFRWESWMSQFKEELPDFNPDLSDGESYVELFRKYCAPVRAFIDANECYLATSSLGNEYDLPPVDWSGSPIEILVYDIGSDPDELNVIWNTFEPSLIAGRSIVVFHEFGKVQSNAIREFCYDRTELSALHGPIGTVRAFRFRGSD